MSRTDEMRQRGATARGGGGGGGGAPFVHWTDSYAWVEGKVVGYFTTQYGDSATFEVTNVHDGLEARGKDEDGEKYRRRVKVGDEVNVGLGATALKDTILDSDKGKYFHIAFEGWQENKSQTNRYRVFTVLEIGPPESHARPGQNVPRYGDDEPWPDEEPADSSLPF